MGDEEREREQKEVKERERGGGKRSGRESLSCLP